MYSGSVFETEKIVRRYCFRREVWHTYVHVFYRACPNPGKRPPNLADAIDFALDEARRIRETGEVIDWVKLAKMESSRFGVPDYLPQGDKHYQTTVSLSPEADAALSEFIREDIAPQFTGQKRQPYRPFAVALLFRAVIANELGELPTKNEE